MSGSGESPSRLSESARRIGASVLEALHLRLDMFALEFGEEQSRVYRLVFAAMGFAIALLLLFVCLNLSLLVIFWDSHRITVVLALTGFYALLAVVLGRWLARQSRRGERAFHATRSVLEQDLRILRDGP